MVTKKSKKRYYTMCEAIDPKTGELCQWVGPVISADSPEEAQLYLDYSGNGLWTVEGLVDPDPFNDNYN